MCEKCTEQKQSAAALMAGAFASLVSERARRAAVPGAPPSALPTQAAARVAYFGFEGLGAYLTETNEDRAMEMSKATIDATGRATADLSPEEALDLVRYLDFVGETLALVTSTVRAGLILRAGREAENDPRMASLLVHQALDSLASEARRGIVSHGEMRTITADAIRRGDPLIMAMGGLHGRATEEVGELISRIFN
jgi:hypothetical protein